MTYTFSNGSTADATQVNTNFTDIINSLTDGTKSLTIDALTCAGTATFNGSVSIGNGSIDDLTVTASLASTVPIKTNNSFDIGSSTLGLQSIYLGAPSSRTTRIRAHQSLSGSHTLVLPNGNGNSGEYIETDGSGNLSFAPILRSPFAAENYSLAASVGSSALTISLKTASGSDPSSTSPVRVVFRNATATTGTVSLVSITAATSVVVPSTATLGHVSGQDRYVYVYLIDGSSADELAVSGEKLFDDGSVASATAISTSADSSDVLYATSTHTNRPVRFLGRIKSNQATAGTWDTTPSEIASTAFLPPILSDWVPFTPTGAWSSNTTYTGLWRRVGDTLQVQVSVATSGAPTSATLTINLPGSLTIDTSKLVGSGANILLGHAIIFDGGNEFSGAVVFQTTTTLLIRYWDPGTATNGANSVTQVAPITFGAGDGVTASYQVPIVGWSATH